MADDRQLSINIRAVTSNLTSGLNKAKADIANWASSSKDSIAGVEAATERISRLWRSAFQAFIAVEAVNALKKIALGASEAADELDVAARVAKNFGHILDPAMMEAWLEAFARSARGGGYAVDDMRKSVQLFSSLGLDVAQTQRAIADTANLAAARNMDWATAAHVVQMALTGHVAMLTRYGVISVEAAKKIKTVEQAMQALEKATRGAADVRADTLIGSFGRLSTAVQLLGVSLGTALIPFFTSLSNLLTNLANAIDSVPAPIMKAVGAFLAFGTALAATVLILPAFAKLFAILGEGMRLLIGFVLPLINGLSLLTTAFEAAAVGEWAMAAGFVAAALGPALIAAGITALGIIIVELIRHFDDWKAAWTDLVALLEFKWRAFVADFEALTRPLATVVQNIVEVISALWKLFVTFLSGAWTAFVNDFREKMKLAIQQFGDLMSALKPVMDTWDRFTQYLSDRFGEFVNKLGLQVDDVKDMLQGMMAGFGIAGPLGALLGGIAGAGGQQKGGAGAFGGPTRGLGSDLAKLGADFKSDMASLGNIFKSSLGAAPNIPGEKFGGLTTEGLKKPGGGKDAGPAEAADRLKNAEEAVKEIIAALANHVADARHAVEKSTTSVDLYKAGLPGGAPQNQEQAATLQKLLTNEMEKQLALHNALEEQQRAETAAAASFESYAARISVHLKNHDQLVRQAKDAALAHVRAAQQLGEEYLRIGVTLAQLKNDMRAAFETGVRNETQAQVDAAEQMLAAQKIANAQNVEAIDQAMAMAQVGGTAGITFSGPAPSTGVKHAQEQVEKESRTGGGHGDTTYEDRLKVALAQLGVAMADDEAAEKSKIVALREAAYEAVKNADNLRALTDAQTAAAQSALDLVKANDTLAVAQQKLQLDIAQKWDTLMNGLVEKIGAPGLSGGGTATSPLSFNPMAMLFAAIEQTQTFGNIMTTVTQIVQTFAQALDALKPIIDALLDVIRAVVNVFIFMYNAVARLLEMIGIQVQQLQYLNAAIGNLVPLIEIWHEIPTLNELAAGKLNSPLSTQPQGLQSVGGPGQGQNGIMKVVELLTGILVAIIVTKLLEGQSLAAAVQSTARLIGINIASVKSANEAPILSAQQKAATTTAANLVNSTAQMVGGKAQAASTVTNNLLAQILAAIEQLVATSSIGGGGGLFGAIASIAGKAASVGAGAGMAGAVGGPGGLLGPVQAVGNAMQAAVRAIQSHTQALTQNLNAVQTLTAALHGAAAAASALRSSAGLDAISTSLSLDTSRRIAVSGYGINRVPGM
jgi:hypothetical protein